MTAPQVYTWAGDADVDDVVTLVHTAYRGGPGAAGWTTEADLIGGQRLDAAMLREVLAEPATHVLLAREDGVLLMCCELREPAEPGGAAYFGMFAVDPTLQGGGHGKRMLAEAERIARQEFGAGALEMQVVRQRVDLIAWYERRGYALTGRLLPFPYDDERYGRPRVADLEFAVLRKELRG